MNDLEFYKAMTRRCIGAIEKIGELTEELANVLRSTCNTLDLLLSNSTLKLDDRRVAEQQLKEIEAVLIDYKNRI